MCIAIHKPFGQVIPTSHLLEGFRSNPHGAGVMYSNGKSLRMYKGAFSVAEFKEYFLPLNVPDLSVVFHFRWSTGGGVNEKNCHPFQIDANHGMVHNGTLTDYCGFKNGFSDTFNFNETVLKPLFQKDPTLYKQPFMVKILNAAIKDGNKILIMDRKGEVTIYGEHLGNVQKLCWYSNFDYLPEKRNRKVLAQKFSGVKAKAFGAI